MKLLIKFNCKKVPEKRLDIKKFNSKFLGIETARNLKNNDKIWNKKHYPNLTNTRKTNKKGGKKKEGNLPKPLPSFSFFRPLLSLFPTTDYIKIKKL